jgi:ferritin-like metal-binding protein YciE
MDDLFLHALQDIYYAENQIVKALPKMIAIGRAIAARGGLTPAFA